MKSAKEIREAFFKFWTQRGHAEIQNASLVPQNDPTLLFVNSGMFPLVPYLLGEKHPQGTRLCNFQKSLRVQDIEDIGDNRHTTFFEMMGNWSLGDYFKAEQIPWFLELYVDYFGLDVNRIFVTVFEGNEDSPLDQVSIDAWQKAFAKYGIEAKVGDSPADVYKNFGADGNLINPKSVYKIFKFPKKKNWWDRGAMVAGEPGGPDSELFYDFGPKAAQYEDPDEGVNSDNGRFIEIGNSVFMEFKLNSDLKWEKLAQQNVDFGGGYERVVMCAQEKNDVFATDLFEGIRTELERMSGLKYTGLDSDTNTKHFRVVMDHLRGATFILAENVYPSNKDQGYVLRRLIRRMIRHGRSLGLNANFTKVLAAATIEFYKSMHPQLGENETFILEQIEKEETKFRNTLDKGLKEFDKIINSGVEIDGAKAFWMYETYGFPFEMIVEELKSRNAFGQKNEAEFIRTFTDAKEQHQSNSRSGAEKKFKGGLADQSEQTTRLHTAHHLLLAALQKVLGHHVHQRGSNITAERLRIDFSHTDKLTDDQVAEVEKIVNEVIDLGFNVIKKILPIEVAQKIGAEMEFGQKYGDLVNVYFIVDPDIKFNPDDPAVEMFPHEKIFSKEFCGGPHVENTKELAKSGRFKIAKQESIGNGIRRIKAILQ